MDINEGITPENFSSLQIKLFNVKKYEKKIPSRKTQNRFFKMDRVV